MDDTSEESEREPITSEQLGLEPIDFSKYRHIPKTSAFIEMFASSLKEVIWQNNRVRTDIRTLQPQALVKLHEIIDAETTDKNRAVQAQVSMWALDSDRLEITPPNINMTKDLDTAMNPEKNTAHLRQAAARKLLTKDELKAIMAQGAEAERQIKEFKEQQVIETTTVDPTKHER